MINTQQLYGLTAPHEMQKVKGINSARMYPTSPNSNIALFEEDDDVFYFVHTDASNFKTIRRFRFVEEPIETESNNFVSKEEFNALHKEIDDVKQLIQQLSDSVSKSAKPKHGNGRDESTNLHS